MSTIMGGSAFGTNGVIDTGNDRTNQDQSNSNDGTMTSRVGDLFYSTLNSSFDTAISAVEEVYTARSRMPGARDVDEDYDNGPQSPFGRSLDGARSEVRF